MEKNDMISRAVAIEEIARRDVTDGTVKIYCGREINAILGDLPAVDAVPVVHGRWVDEEGNPVPWSNTHPLSPAYSCWCNQCKTWLVASDEYPVYGLFCPACGANMDGERRDDDGSAD